MNKISFVVQDLVGQGVQHATAMMVRAFSADGWDVDLVVSQVHLDYLKEGRKAFEIPAAVHWVYLPNRRSSRNIFALRRYISKCGSDVIVSESGLYTSCIACATVGMSRKHLPRLVQVIHGNEEKITGGLITRIKRNLVNRFTYRHFSSVMFVNDKSRCNFSTWGNFVRHLRLVTVNNAIVDETYRNALLKPVKHPWLKHKECPTFVIAGSYTSGKRHIDAIKAFEIVNKTSRARLIIYGRGPLEGQYRKIISDNHLEDIVSIAGYCDSLPAEINAADCLLSASDEESFGITIVEALACGTPVIATDCPYGPHEILDGGKYGVLVPVGDVQAMACAVVRFVDGVRLPVPDIGWSRYTVEVVLEKYKTAILP